MVAGWQPDFNPAAAFFEMWSRVISPYQSNPLNLNPLRSLLVEQVDFARVRACKKMQLFVTATNVHTGRERIFSGRELTVDAVLASACLPHIFQAVEIDGVPYWDGGFVGNPSILPFVDSCASRDVLLVQINPIERRGTPRTAREILDRMNEISFNAPLLKELIQIDFVNTHVRDGRLADHGYREIFLHRIGGGPELAAFQATSKFNVDLAFLTRLRDLGRADADTWLRQHYSDLGQRGTLDVQHLTGRLLAKTHAT
jgi:NTE family protein